MDKAIINDKSSKLGQNKNVFSCGTENSQCSQMSHKSKSTEVFGSLRSKNEIDGGKWKTALYL